MNHGPCGVAEYAITESRCGEPSLAHCPSGIRLHSAVDPAAEARAAASALLPDRSSDILLIGGGLGYLAEALLECMTRKQNICCAEIEPALLALATRTRPASAYLRSPRIRVETCPTMSVFSARLRSCPDDSAVIVAPYLYSLSSWMFPEWKKYLTLLRTERASAPVYERVLPTNREKYSNKLASALPWDVLRLPTHRAVVIVGAGPSLDSAFPFMLNKRSELAVIAASGAVPPLMRRGIFPDVVVLLEASDAPVADLQELPGHIPCVCFPFANLSALSGNALFNAQSENTRPLASRGGTSLVPALDLALTLSSAPVFLVGADLSSENGHYAEGARRVSRPMIGRSPVKFSAMRFGLESVLIDHDRGRRNVFHVVQHNQPLTGTIRMTPEALNTDAPDTLRQYEIHDTLG